MALAAGARLGSYEILSALGSGGMGEVYRARDSKLNRDVAIKILPAAFASDPDRLARFQREAQVLAALNHPHIAQIHGLDAANGTQFLVLELVDGESLDRRIARGPISVDEALAIAKHIAEALEAAHERGIIHRDLKPANIALTKDDRVKVLDFGLAKAVEMTSGSSDAMNSPTITSPAMMTGVGVILGTAAYMSPEQAKGRVADKRSDVWAFGCVLYEMLAGKRAFESEDVADTLATVLKGDVDWKALPSSVPDAVRAMLEGCLRKDRNARIGDMSTAVFLLSRPHAMTAVLSPSKPWAQGLWGRTRLVAAGLLIGAVATAPLQWRAKPSPAVPVTRLAFGVPQGQRLSLARKAVAISPDGTRIVYAADGRLYLRAMSALEPRPIAGADPGQMPAFSPDGQSLAFFFESSMKRIAVDGGVAVTICDVFGPSGGISWGNNGILFAQQGTGILRVSPSGGKPEVVVALNTSDGLADGPQLLPGGDTVLFTLAKGSSGGPDRWDKANIVVQSLRTGERKTLIEGGTDARYVPTGHIVYALGGTLFAVPFDLAKLAVTAGPVPVVEGVSRVTAVSVGTAHFAFSHSGSLVYLPGPTRPGQQDLFLFDRKGGAQALQLPPGSYVYPRVSPDGERLALEVSDGKEAFVAIYDLSGTSSVRRLTFGGNNRLPIWSADGRRVAFQSDREGDRAVFWQPADGGTAERLTKPDPGTSHVPESWSPTGEGFLFSVTKGGETSLWTFSLRDRKAVPFDDVRSMSPTDAVFSPDGRWVAYQIADRGAVADTSLYVQPFPPSGTKYQIAATGGRPLWSRDGKELFYVPAPNQFMAVAISTQPSFTFTNPVSVPRGFGSAEPYGPRTFDITPDGRIVGAAPLGRNQIGSSGPAQIQVVLNWFEELKARVPTK